MSDTTISDDFDAEMQHPDLEKIKERKERLLALTREKAGAYARLFNTPDGERVLADLRKKFGHDRRRFIIENGRHDTIRAALIDGQCDVLREIEQGIDFGSH